MAKHKKVLGIVASPRKLGNCEIAVKEISRNIPEEHELKILRLSDYELNLCRGCYQCLFKEKACVMNDGLIEIMDTMAEADAYIVASPTYFFGPNASLKLLLDRGLSFYSRAEELWQKPSAGLAIAGIPGKEGYTLLGINSFLKAILSDIKTSSVMYAAFPGEVFANEKNKEKAQYIGRSMFRKKSRKPEVHCPLCGGDTFRFLGDNKVRCMLCSNSGVINTDSGKITFDMEKDEHEIFLSHDKALEHKEWLKDMKNRFFDNIAGLKKIRDKYK